MPSRLLAAALSLNRVGFGLAYMVAPARAGRGWIGRASRDPATQVFIRGHGGRDLVLGAGSLVLLARGESRLARRCLAAQAVVDGIDVVSTVAAHRRLPKQGHRFAPFIASLLAANGAAHSAPPGRGLRLLPGVPW